MLSKLIPTPTKLANILSLKNDIKELIRFRMELELGGTMSGGRTPPLTEASVSDLTKKLAAVSESELRQAELIERVVELEDQHSSELMSLSRRVIVFQLLSIGSLGFGTTALVLALFLL